MKFTVFGGTGFIGAHLVRHLRKQGHSVSVPSRDGREIAGDQVGHAIYAIGVTSDFRNRMHDTIEAHVGTLERLMHSVAFDSWLTLSSTRVYGCRPGASETGEDVAIAVAPGADTLYDISKLLGEAITLANTSATARVARLSNVFGAGQSTDSFLASVLADVLATGRTALCEAPESAKDYIAVDEVCRLLEAIALHGSARLYNVASGRNTSHRQLASLLTDAAGARVEFAPGAPVRRFPPIDTTRAAREFGQAANRLADHVRNTLSSKHLDLTRDPDHEQ